MGKERRHHKRYCVKGLKNRLRKNRFFGFLSKTTLEEYPCLDISESGLQFVTKRVFNQENRLGLDITTPFTRNAPIRVKAQVAWSKTPPGFGFHLIGVHFVSINKSQHAELKMLVERAGQDKDKIPRRIQVKMMKEASSHL